MKLCVFPNDSLLSYYNKGEIKFAYYNPLNFFDEIHVISLFDDEIDGDKVQSLAGKAQLVIHKFGKANLTNYKKYEKKINAALEHIQPDIIRTYNPLVQGWLAVKASKKLGVPLVLSVHTNYHQQREEVKKKNYLKYLKLLYASKLEPFVFKNANAVICAYKFIVPYAEKMGAKNIHVIYNRVDLSKFSPSSQIVSEKPIILSVGRLIDQKNHKYLIGAIKDLDAKLVIIGDGPNYDSLNKFAEKTSVKNKVEFIKKIPNNELVEYYRSATIYAQPMENLEGIPIPVLEAMASGLPVLMSKTESGITEVIDNAIIFVENSSDAFREACRKILENKSYRETLRTKSLETIKKIDGSIMEQKELELYKSIMK